MCVCLSVIAQRMLNVEARPRGQTFAQFFADGAGSTSYMELPAQELLRRRSRGSDSGSQLREHELYLVQHPVDVAPPLWMRASGLPVESANLWMSGSPDGGEVSACHFDLSDNLVTMIAGSKTFTLIPPGDTPLIYPAQPGNARSFEPPYSSIRDVSIDGFASSNMTERQRWPRLAWARRTSVVLQPGDVLFLPRLWWHQVANAPAPSTSLNFWFRNAHK